MHSTPFETIFKSLNEEKVDYILVGGLAVVLHGHLRTTSDIDLVLALNSKNVLSAVKALKKLDYKPRPPVPFEDFANEKKRKEWIEEKGLTVFSTFSPKYPTVEIDLFVSEPFDFKKVFDRSVKIKINAIEVKVASIDDLIDMKKKVLRPIDQEDIRMLEWIRDEKNRK